MSVMGVQKKVWMGVGGWGEFCRSLFWIFGIFFIFQSPLVASKIMEIGYYVTGELVFMPI